jgi:hypothetical protein
LGIAYPKPIETTAIDHLDGLIELRERSIYERGPDFGGHQHPAPFVLIRLSVGEACGQSTGFAVQLSTVWHVCAVALAAPNEYSLGQPPGYSTADFERFSRRRHN